MKKYVLVAIALMLTVTLAGAQNPGKPWTEWSEKEVDKMLRNSPWSVRQVADMVRYPYSANDSSRFSPPMSLQQVREMDNMTWASMRATNFNIRLLSAFPIRQALARRVELGAHSSDPALRQQLDDFVNRKFDDWIVISVDFDLEQGQNPAPVTRFFKEASLNSLTKYTYLEIKDSRRIPLVDYKPPNGDGLGAKFIFPRMENGRPTIPDGTKELRFYSQLDRFLVIDSRFKFSEMSYQGRIEY